MTIRDLSKVATGAIPVSAERLFEVWSADYDELESNVEAKDRILVALEQVRRDTHAVLQSLD